MTPPLGWGLILRTEASGLRVVRAYIHLSDGTSLVASFGARRYATEAARSLFEALSSDASVLVPRCWARVTGGVE